jgi:hypothetical protein
MIVGAILMLDKSRNRQEDAIANGLTICQTEDCQDVY